MASQIAREMFKVKHVITRIFDTHGLHIFDTAGFVTISSPELTVDAFMRELEDRDLESQMDFNIHHIMGESVQFTLLQADSEVCGCKIREIEDTDARHVFGIMRNDHMILALPNMRIEKGDKLLLASL
jgi:Trk K+ transport system NAD-binding subunit